MKPVKSFGSDIFPSAASHAGSTDDASVYTRPRMIDVSDTLLLENRIVAIAEHDPVNERFRLLRTRIFGQKRQKEMTTIQVTGFGSGAGASVVALNLAVSIARDTGQATLLVDLNFQCPSIARMLGLSADYPGLRSCLLENHSWEELLICPGIEKLTILPAGGMLRNSTEMLGSPVMERLVLEWRQRYSEGCVVLDTPGLGVCPDPMIISEYSDGIILVARAGHTRAESIRPAMNLIPAEKLLGVVLNDAAPGDGNGYW